MDHSIFLGLFFTAATVGPFVGHLTAERASKTRREEERRIFSRIFREEFVEAAKLVGDQKHQNQE